MRISTDLRLATTVNIRLNFRLSFQKQNRSPLKARKALSVRLYKPPPFLYFFIKHKKYMPMQSEFHKHPIRIPCLSNSDYISMENEVLRETSANFSISTKYNLTFFTRFRRLLIVSFSFFNSFIPSPSGSVPPERRTASGKALVRYPYGRRKPVPVVASYRLWAYKHTFWKTTGKK